MSVRENGALGSWNRDRWVAPLVARMAAAFLASLAFSSMTFHPMSSAMARATVVLPTPGGPISRMAFFFGVPFCHSSSHARILRRWTSLPSSNCSGPGRCRQSNRSVDPCLPHLLEVLQPSAPQGDGKVVPPFDRLRKANRWLYDAAHPCRSRTVTVPSSSDWWSTVMQTGTPISSARA